MNEVFYVLYILVAFITCVVLTFKSTTQNRFVTFVISFWFLAHSVLGIEMFIIDIKGLPFDLQPRRLIFIIFLAYLLLLMLKNALQKTERKKILKYEMILYLYVAVSIFVSYMHNRAIVSVKEIILMNIPVLSFAVIYVVLKKTADEGMLRVFVKSFHILCVATSVIGLCQVVVSQYFFRIRDLRIAYGGIYRSTGVFPDEYTHSYFLVTGVILALFTVQSQKWRRFLIGLYFSGILLSFHRMSWITLAVLVLLFFIVVKKQLSKLVIIGASAGVLAMCLLLMLSPDIESLKSSSLYRQRLTDKTMGVRMRINEMVLRNIHKNWLLGFGSKESDMYYFGMLEADAGMDFAMDERGGIHNGFLMELFFKGAIVFVLYILFFIFAIDYFVFLGRFRHAVFWLAAFELLKFVLASLTNGFSLGTSLGLLMAIALGVSAAIKVKEIYTENELFNQIPA